jgi:hypothetical protein
MTEGTVPTTNFQASGLDGLFADSVTHTIKYTANNSTPVSLAGLGVNTFVGNQDNTQASQAITASASTAPTAYALHVTSGGHQGWIYSPTDSNGGLVLQGDRIWPNGIVNWSKASGMESFPNLASPGTSGNWQITGLGNILIQTNVANTTIFSGGFNANTTLQAYDNTKTIVIAANGGPTTVGGVFATSVGTVIASATTIAPTSNSHHVSGTAAVATITVPTGFTGGCITLVPDGAFTTTTAGNISLASTAVVNKALQECWDGTKWNPSY